MPNDSLTPADTRLFEKSDSELTPLPTYDDESALFHPNESADDYFRSDGSGLLEKEMRRRLMDIESSFLPAAPSRGVAPGSARGDAACSLDRSPGHVSLSGQPTAYEPSSAMVSNGILSYQRSLGQHTQRSESPLTPSDAYKTPAAQFHYDRDSEAGAEDSDDSAEDENASLASSTPSSPAAAAAERTLARAYAGEGEHDEEALGEDIDVDRETFDHETRDEGASRPASQASTIKGGGSGSYNGMSGKLMNESPTLEPNGLATSMSPGTASSRPAKRSGFVHNRQVRQHSSTSAITSRSDLSWRSRSDAMVGTDYALQAGGAAPDALYGSSSAVRPDIMLSRLPSFASMTSTISRHHSLPAPQLELEWPRLNTDRVSKHYVNDDSVLVYNGSLSFSLADFPPFTSPNTLQNTLFHSSTHNASEITTQPIHNNNNHNNSTSTMAPPPTPSPVRMPLGFRAQQEYTENLAKENFSLKLRIWHQDQYIRKLEGATEDGVTNLLRKNTKLESLLVQVAKKLKSLQEEKEAPKVQTEQPPSPPSTAKSSIDFPAKSSINNPIKSAIIEQLEDKVGSLRDQLSRSRLDRLKQQDQIANLEQTVEAQQSQLEEVKLNNQEQHEELERLRRQNRLLRDEVAQHESQQQEVERLRRLNMDLQEDLGRLRRRSHKQDVELKRRADLLESREAEITTLTDALRNPPTPPPASTPSSARGQSRERSSQGWFQRFRDAQRRLKAEREARLLDRDGARKRLEEERAQKERLEIQLKKEKARRVTTL